MGFLKKIKRKIADYQQRSAFPMAYSQRKSGHVHNCDCEDCNHNHHVRGLSKPYLYPEPDVNSIEDLDKKD